MHPRTLNKGKIDWPGGVLPTELGGLPSLRGPSSTVACWSLHLTGVYFCFMWSPHDNLHIGSLTIYNTSGIAPARPKCLAFYKLRDITWPYHTTLIPWHNFNPWRACAVRVTVLGLCVCVCLSVCLSALILALCTTRQPKSDTNGFSATLACFLNK